MDRPYCPSTAPHKDWLVLRGRSPREDGTISAITGLQRHALNTATLWLPAPPQSTVLCFEGRAHDRHRPILTADDAEAALSRGAHLSGDLRGSYTALVQDRNDLLICTDPLGLSQVYRFDCPDGTLLSNRLHTLAIAVRALFPNHAHLDETAALATLLFDTPFSDRTLIEGARMLPALDVIRIDRDGISTFPRTITDAHTFDDAISAALDELRENAEAVSAHADALSAKNVIHLSGGLDSRLVLAAIARAGRLDATARYTYGALDSGDRTIADSLAAHFGVPFLDPAQDALPLSLDGLLDRWCSFTFGAKSAFSVDLHQSPLAHVRSFGGVGEAMRSFYAAMAVAKTGQDPDGLDDTALADLLLKIQSRPQFFRPGALEGVRDDLRRFFRGQDAPASAKLDSVYGAFRNRYHFGLAMRIENMSGPTYCPLYSPHAIRASDLLPEAQRRAGRAMFALLWRLSPELAIAPTTSAPWSDAATAGFPYARFLQEHGNPLRPVETTISDNDSRRRLSARAKAMRDLCAAALRETNEYVCGRFEGLTNTPRLLGMDVPPWQAVRHVTKVTSIRFAEDVLGGRATAARTTSRLGNLLTALIPGRFASTRAGSG